MTSVCEKKFRQKYGLFMHISLYDFIVSRTINRHSWRLRWWWYYSKTTKFFILFCFSLIFSHKKRLKIMKKKNNEKKKFFFWPDWYIFGQNDRKREKIAAIDSLKTNNGIVLKFSQNLPIINSYSPN